MKRSLWIATLLVSLFTFFGAHDVYAQSKVVSDCSSDAQLRQHLDEISVGAGGTITFNCGSGAVTIVSTTFLGGIFSNVVIDGGGRVTLSGGNATHLFEVADTGALTLRNLRITRALHASDGGAIHAVGGLVIENVTFDLNRSTAGTGGAIWSSGALTIRNSRFVENEALHGGAIYSSATAPISIVDSTFTGNKATTFTSYGGAINLNGAALANIVASRFVENETRYAGGALRLGASSAVTITSSLFQGNVSSNSGSAIDNRGTLLLRQSLLHSNQASAMGTGGSLFNNGDATVVNTTIANNRGPGVDTFGAHTTRIFNSTISGNQSYGFQGGYGILAGSGTVVLKNTIMHGNAPNCQIYGSATLTSEGFNISSDATCALAATDDMVSTDPLLAPLGNFGGPTLSMHPLPGSPAIDNGQCDASILVDQRGIARPAGDACDIGAVEVGWVVWLAIVGK